MRWLALPIVVLLATPLSVAGGANVTDPEHDETVFVTGYHGPDAQPGAVLGCRDSAIDIVSASAVTTNGELTVIVQVRGLAIGPMCDGVPLAQGTRYWGLSGSVSQTDTSTSFSAHAFDRGTGIQGWIGVANKGGYGEVDQVVVDNDSLTWRIPLSGAGALHYPDYDINGVSWGIVEAWTQDNTNNCAPLRLCMKFVDQAELPSFTT